MPITVLVVDDSGFFRRRVCELLSTDARIKPIGTASNGREAVEKAIELKPDVITMDYEMPVLDGISAVREIMQKAPVPVLMFSSLTHEGARITLGALEAGAVDYLPKNFEDISRRPDELAKALCDKVIEVSRSKRGALASSAKHIARPERRSSLSSVRPASRPSLTPTQSEAPKRVSPAKNSKPQPRHFDLVAIGTSTGGPMALQTVLTQLPENFPAPLLLVQHMPAAFTGAFAERLNSLCKIQVKEAQDGDVLKPGLALLAPGGKQMVVDKRGSSVRILAGDERLNYKPCVDVTFGSAANAVKGNILGVIMTGMGADGRDGCRMLKEHGATIWSQDEDSSVIYGMPMAVAKAGLSDEVLSLNDLGYRLSTDVSR
ncbi:protein-glutamate methylesterase/protein-glutamine glutaminase [Oceanospirillum linum]|uniref:Protein-glutamate methylesterase/protein-glutamine glutaminase n=1 Tax=Oceanospirillum linum TaxID=966 RepID=A0A1T1HFC7_OCELI|nr:chemotaxis response regulator protein-glutamate methylesterase [Oceanospirillum linum]OOV88559.1 chemotaxis response regulator protein-glutamate methylesterase [Oceanospirillum linum]SEF60798.1 two-component system, chemotaxis family, response regulator CheB [Oleiphilus messinensis]SMP07007.1 two-component system, chemotaxis family, response regulator CheB [Oceanospirillum linum]